MKILVTGGAGYIGSHTVVELLNQNYEVVIYDNLSNSKIEVLNRIEKITGKRPVFIQDDILNINGLRNVFKNNKFDAVIHFAGLKAVGESVQKPLEYYNNNIVGTINLLFAMREANCYNIVFSSSATVYGEPKSMPIDESFDTLQCTNPYGTTKLYIENIMKDLYKSDNNFNIALLRYFNPIGAHESGLIGEDPNGIPNNLVPYVTQVAIGKREYVRVFGNDYNTIDGTGVRDYIHVVDLAKGHLLAINKVLSKSGLVIYNLGTGKGSSVLEVINAFSKAVNKDIPYKIMPRRAGDIATSYAKCDKAFKELGFKAQYDLTRMAIDSWRWQKNNPNGYEK